MDSHADTTVMVKGCLVVHDSNSPVNVTRYDPEDENKVFRTVTGVLFYGQFHTGNPYFLVINQAIYLDCLGHRLMCPMQCRTNGINISETSKY